MKKRPRLIAALSLRCPYCNQSPLLAQGSWFKFAQGCKTCDYSFEREVGYFTGASWMIAFPIHAVGGLVLAALGKLFWFPKLPTYTLISLVSLVVLLVALLSFPVCMAVWLYFDHCLHPLDNDDSYSDQT